MAINLGSGLGSLSARMSSGATSGIWRSAIADSVGSAVADTIASTLAGKSQQASKPASSGGLLGFLKNIPIVGKLFDAGDKALRSLPLVGNFYGSLADQVSGRFEQAIRFTPLLGNVYDAAKGLFAGDFKSAAQSIAGLIPFVGPALQFFDGLRKGNAVDVIGGAAGFALDFATAGEGHLLTGRATARFPAI